MSTRTLESYIRQDLREKMVFLSGPRQTGKTTLAFHLLKGNEDHPAYFNWDYLDDQKKLLGQQFPADQKLLVFDEIHKFRNWRNWLKGIYDKTKSKKQYLVTGSARLDYYKRGGDALTGRYHSHRLHPLSLGEIDPDCKADSAKALLTYGGFPEPFYRQSERTLRRWQNQRLQQVLRDDLRDLQRLHEVTLIAQMAEHLPNLVGSPLSLNSLREDLQVSHPTVANWVKILERLYFIFIISPFGAPRIRAVKKEPKSYLWDWMMVKEPGPRFENFVASHLLKYCHFQEDTQGYRMELRYLRDTDKRETDFVVIKEGKPLFAVECKLSDTTLDSSLAYFAQRTNIPQFYQVHLGTGDYEHSHLPVRVLPFHVFCKHLGLP